MLAFVYGFDWEAYTDNIMPAFTRWLIHGDEKTIYQLYERTRCAREEQFTPMAIRHLLTWPRAQAFVQQLPQGTYMRHEYQLICDSLSFTMVSDIYVHRHPPRLHQNSDALRAIWGALVEQYCQPWLSLPDDITPTGSSSFSSSHYEQFLTTHDTGQHDIISLLRSAGFGTLAREIGTQSLIPDLAEEDHCDTVSDSEPPSGVILGHHPATLHLRGWLATLSVRAMALFEFLACGRRSMPFGYRSGEPYEDYIGYLTPGEVQQLALCLQNVDAPKTLYSAQGNPHAFMTTNENSPDSCLIDEIIPAHADAFLRVVRAAAQYNLGLTCRMG